MGKSVAYRFKVNPLQFGSRSCGYYNVIRLLKTEGTLQKMPSCRISQAAQVIYNVICLLKTKGTLQKMPSCRIPQAAQVKRSEDQVGPMTKAVSPGEALLKALGSLPCVENAYMQLEKEPGNRLCASKLIDPIL